MKQEINWLKGALTGKEIIVNMTYYKIQDGQIQATDGRIIAGHPWPYDGEALVPGIELEKIVSRVPEDQDIDLKFNKKNITVNAGDFRAFIPVIADLNTWAYPGIENKKWSPVPENLHDALVNLKPFISSNATQPWANCIALKEDWAYATNNIAVAGMPCPGLGKINLLLPLWAVEFMLKRTGITHWQFTDNYIAFKWDNGAWMRTQIVQGEFPISAFKMVQEAAKVNPTQVIDEKFRQAFARLNGLVEEPLRIYANRLWGKLREAEIEETVVSEIPASRDHTIWSMEHLKPVVECATHWNPGLWPKPVPFKGEKISGVIMGRVS